MKGTSIKQWRKFRRMTQEDLAARLGMTPGNLSKLERGLIPYGQVTIELAAAALECDESDLLRPFVEPQKPSVAARLMDLFDRLTPDQQKAVESTASLFACQNAEAVQPPSRRAAGD